MSDSIRTNQQRITLGIATFVLLMLITISNLNSRYGDGFARKVFARMLAFELPETARIIEFNYNAFNQEAYYDIAIPDDCIEKVRKNVYDFLSIQMCDLDAMRDDGGYTQESESNLFVTEKYWFPLSIFGNDFPRLRRKSGKGFPWMTIILGREKETGTFRLILRWWAD